MTRQVGLALLAAIATWAAVGVWTRPRWTRRRQPDARRIQGEGLVRSAQPPSPSTAGVVWSQVLRGRVPRFGRARAPDVGTLLAALAAELDSGQALEAALEQACRGLEPVPCPRALAAARIGGDVAEGLREDARAGGGSGLRALAACWQVAGRSGSGLSASVQRLAHAQRSAARSRGELLAQMATVRATARLLAGLPVVGVLFGMAMGAQPLTWLGATWMGRAVLLAGLALQGLGLLWMHRIVARAQGGIP